MKLINIIIFLLFLVIFTSDDLFANNIGPSNGEVGVVNTYRVLMNAHIQSSENVKPFERRLLRITGTERDLINQMREQMFRKKEQTLLYLYERFEVRSDVYNRLSEVYDKLKRSKSIKDKYHCDWIFEELSRLEVRLNDTDREINRIQIQLLKARAIDLFDSFLKKYKKAAKNKSHEVVGIKLELLYLIRETANKLNFPEESIEKIQERIESFSQLAGLYSDWKDNVDKVDVEYVDVNEAAYEEKLPTKPHDSSDAKGRRNYLDRVTKREKDLRSKNFQNVQSIQDTAPNESEEKFKKNLVYDRDMQRRLNK